MSGFCSRCSLGLLNLFFQSDHQQCEWLQQNLEVSWDHPSKPGLLPEEGWQIYRKFIKKKCSKMMQMAHGISWEFAKVNSGKILYSIFMKGTLITLHYPLLECLGRAQGMTNYRYRLQMSRGVRTSEKKSPVKSRKIPIQKFKVPKMEGFLNLIRLFWG